MRTKKFVICIIATCLLCLTMVGAAFANEKNLKKTITLQESITVNDMVIKKGTYRVLFDAKASEVSIMEEDGDLVLKTKATVEMRSEKARYNSAAFKTTDRGQQLESLTFAGDRRAVVLADTTNKVSDGE